MEENVKNIISDYILTHKNEVYVTENCIYLSHSFIRELYKTFSSYINLHEILKKEYICIYGKTQMMIMSKEEYITFTINISKLIYNPHNFEPVQKKECIIDDKKYFEIKEIREIYKLFMGKIFYKLVKNV